MSATTAAPTRGIGKFRTKLLIAMALVVFAITALGLYLAQKKVEIEAQRDLLQDFQNELATLHGVQEVRQAAVAERCRVLVRRARIHAALEDNALDLLYPSARDELRDVVASDDAPSVEQPGEGLNARFYRFLDSRGAVIHVDDATGIGELAPEEEAQIALHLLPREQQLGYLWRRGAHSGADAVDEIIAVPIVSMETGDVIAALVLGFHPVELGRNRAGSGIRAGIWARGRLHLPALATHEQEALASQIGPVIASSAASETSLQVSISGVPHLLFLKQLNPGSLYPAAYEIAVYPLAEAIARRRQILWHVLLAGGALLVIGLFVSHFVAARLATPVEELAVESEEHLTHWQRAESALEATNEELQRSARFSADASHQLKTPVTVLRAGIEELLLRDDFVPEVYDALSALLHQTYRITGVVDDLLLLSRVDAGRLQIQLKPVDLNALLAEWLDDFSALPDELQLQIETELPPDIHVSGDQRYVSVIVQNLLENARKYNRSGGRIRVMVREEGEFAVLNVGNTGRTITGPAREHIFERFHRGEMGENVPGHGLGLNLARELARLHGGDVRLVRSGDDWTEFEVRLRVARAPIAAAAQTR